MEQDRSGKSATISGISGVPVAQVWEEAALYVPYLFSSRPDLEQHLSSIRSRAWML
jgi:hypothetical protein